MTEYNAYFLDRNKGIVQSKIFECASDEEASRQAAALIDDGPIELWDGKRKVVWLDPSLAAGPIAPSTPEELQTLIAEAAALYKADKFVEAEKCCVRILELDHRNTRILTLLGTLYAVRGASEEAVRLIGLSLEIEPRQPWARNTLGNALKELKRHDEAIVCYDDAIALKPDHAVAYKNRGDALMALNRAMDALPSFDKAIELKPDYVEAYTQRGVALGALNRFREAAESYDKAIALNPYTAEAHKYGGDLCGGLYNFDSALAFYDNAVAIRPNYAAAYHMRANALRNLRRYEEAFDSIEKALQLDPKLFCASGERLFIQMSMCRWDQLSENSEALVNAIECGVPASSPFPILTIDATADIQRRCAELYVNQVFPARQPVSPIQYGSGSVRNRIRVAYVSANFHPHPVARHLVGLIENHDPGQFETIGVSLSGDDGSDIRDRIRRGFNHFIEVGNKSDAEVAAMLRDMEVDIAVDLMAFTQSCRPGIFARRAVPIQVNYLGYPGTMATDFMDYLIADRTVISKHEQDHYAEKIVYMPDCYIPNDSGRAISETPSRAEFGLPETGFVFCSINNSYKFTPEMFDVWMRLLTAVEDSVLWLPQSNSAAVRNLDAEAAARGVSPQRLVFATLVPKSEDHLARLRLADLFLDTLPYNAHSTACEALWAGLPVLTCLGKTFAGRVAASVLKAAGLPEMVTRSLSEYEARALGLARDPQALAEVKAKLAGNRHTHALFDTRRFARHLEKAYLHMVERHRKGELPMSFAVEAMDHVTDSTVS